MNGTSGLPCTLASGWVYPRREEALAGDQRKEANELGPLIPQIPPCCVAMGWLCLFQKPQLLLGDSLHTGSPFQVLELTLLLAPTDPGQEQHLPLLAPGAALCLDRSGGLFQLCYLPAEYPWTCH